MEELKKAIQDRADLLVEAEVLVSKSTTTDDEDSRFDVITEEVKALDSLIIKLEQKEDMRQKIALQKAQDRTSSDPVLDAIVDKGTPKIEIKETAKATEEARNVNTFKLIQGVMTGNSHKIDEARKSLADGGHFDNMLKGKDGSTKGFNTLVDTDGAVLVPSSITSQVMDIMQTYGIIPRLAQNLGDISQSSVKIPQILGRPSFTAVGQGQAIPGSGFNLGAIELKAQKWAAIINWTNEVSDSVAARLMPIIMNKIAEGYAYAQDDVFFNGTGTSVYNNIQGLEGLVGTANYVRLASAVSGNVSHATLDPDDFITPQQNVAPGARAGCVYAMHPNMIFTLRKLKDSAGKYIYGDPSEQRPAGSLWGYPIETSEAFNITDGVSKSVCAFFNPSFVAYATGKSLSIDELKEGSIVDSDGVTVNLATTDQKALRVKGLFDLILSSVTRTTASTAQGAFSVLRTAAS